MEATVCLGYLDLCQGVPWTVSVQIAAQAFLFSILCPRLSAREATLKAKAGQGNGA